MPSLTSRRLTTRVAIVATVLPVLLLLAGAAPPEVKTRTFKGKVVRLADLVRKFGAKLDDDAAASWLALVGDDGTIYPLLKDDGSRMFFQDARLLGRPMRLTARRLPGSNLLQVVHVQSYHDGRLCEVYYWCPVCSIKRFENKPCDCCGGPLELREEPASK